jgi:transposase-like protein
MQRHNKEVVVSGLQLRNQSSADPTVELATKAKILTAFSNALNPVGPIEGFLVEELSRRAAQTRDYDAALDALRREGEAAFLSIIRADGDSDAAENLARAGVVASEKHESLMRQGLASSRGFLRALREIREIRASFVESNSVLYPDPRFCSEQRCLAYLVRRYVHGSCACRRCGAVSVGSFVAAKAAWQCAHCHAQTGLRYGTCMERSALPLTKWFAAIRFALLSPTITTEKLAKILAIDRRQTVRNMIKRIRAAVNSPYPSAALAGLDELYLMN